MIKVTVQKNLIGLEDLLTGVGTVEQSRGPTGTAAVTITKINGSNLPYDANFTMAEKIDALQADIDSLPAVVDEGGNLLTGLINTSSVDLDLTGRLWRKEIDANTVEIYYGTELILQYDPAAGNIIVPSGSAYIAADAVVTTNFQNADSVIAATVSALDTAVAAFKNKSIGTSANNVLALDGDGKIPAVDGSLITNVGAPLGSIAWLSHTTVPTNYLKANGAEVSRTTYAALYALIGDTYGSGDDTTTFNLPDLRGEFIRGWDDGKGTDNGRDIGTFQEDEIKSHSHQYDISDDNGTNTDRGFDSSVGDNNIDYIFDTYATGGDETRPRNIAMMAVIKVL